MGCICSSCCGLVTCTRWWMSCQKGVKQTANCVTGLDREYTPRMEGEYHHILKFKGEKAVWYKPIGSKYTVAQLKYRQDLGRYKCIWHDNSCDDLRQYFRNNHQYFSPFTASRMSPFNRTERLFVLIIAVILSLSLGLVQAAQGAIHPLLFSLINSLIIWVCTSTLTSLGICSIAQGTQCASCRSGCETLSHCFMCLMSTIYVCVLTAVGIILALDSGINIGLTLLGTVLNLVLGCLITDPLLGYLYYLYLCYSDRKESEKALRSSSKRKRRFNVPFDYYLEWKEAGKPEYNGDGDLTEADEKEADGLFGKALKTADQAGNTLRGMNMSQVLGKSTSKNTTQATDVNNNANPGQIV